MQRVYGALDGRPTRRVAIVSGAGSGIERAIALTLVERGAVVVVNDLDAESADVATPVTD